MDILRITAIPLAGASVMICAVAAFFSCLPVAAQERDSRRTSDNIANAYAQAEPSPRTRLRVTPRYPYRTQSLPYPPPYDIEYPGPGFVRQCRSWLAPENRPS